MGDITDAIKPAGNALDHSLARERAFYQVRSECQPNNDHYAMDSSGEIAGLDMLEVVTLLANAQTRVVQDLKVICDQRTPEQRREIRQFFLDNALNARDFIE